MHAVSLPSFQHCRRRFDAASADFDAPPGEYMRLMTYLRQAGATPLSADDVLVAIRSLPEEEELTAYRCREGVAVSHASEGWWLLLPMGEHRPNIVEGDNASLGRRGRGAKAC